MKAESITVVAVGCCYGVNWQSGCCGIYPFSRYVYILSGVVLDLIDGDQLGARA